MAPRRLLAITVALSWAVVFAGPAFAQDARLEAARKEG